MNKPSIHFTHEEFKARQKLTRDCLEKHKLDGLLLFKIEDMYWLSGFDSDGFCIFHNMFIGINGELTHVSRSADLANVKYSSICDDVRTAPDAAGVSWSSCIKKMLDSHHMQGKQIGIQVDTMGLTPRLFLEIQTELQGWCELIVAENFIQEMRMVKSEQELNYHRKAGEFLDVSLTEALDTAKAGVFEGDIYGAFYRKLFSMGADLPAHIPPLGCGDSALNVRYTSGRKHLSENDQLTLELGLAYRHYHAGSMCVALTGPEINDLHLQMHAALVPALAEVQNMLRPGKTMGEVYDTYRMVVTDHGLAHTLQTACGYTMGATWPPTWMEQPMFYTGNQTIIKKNMTFFNMLILSDFETGLIMCLGEQVIITDGKPEVISHVPKNPIILDI
jgi:Xaa-Pro dipeptidase